MGVLEKFMSRPAELRSWRPLDKFHKYANIVKAGRMQWNALKGIGAHEQEIAFNSGYRGHVLGVAVGSVANWIDQNQLKAGRTPGGHRRVQAVDLVAFLKQQNLPIPAELTPTTTILVVDDEPAISTWVAEKIKEHIPNCIALQANDGFSAGELVGTVNPRVVILDLRNA